MKEIVVIQIPEMTYIPTEFNFGKMFDFGFDCLKEFNQNADEGEIITSKNDALYWLLDDFESDPEGYLEDVLKMSPDYDLWEEHNIINIISDAYEAFLKERLKHITIKCNITYNK